MVWNHGQKLLLLPTEEQARVILRIIGCACFIRNYYLDTRMRFFREKAASLNDGTYEKNICSSSRSGKSAAQAEGYDPEGILSNSGRILKATVLQDGRDYMVSLCLDHTVDRIAPLNMVSPD